MKRIATTNTLICNLVIKPIDTQSTPNIREGALEDYKLMRFGEVKGGKTLRRGGQVKAKKFFTNETKSILLLF